MLPEWQAPNVTQWGKEPFLVLWECQKSQQPLQHHPKVCYCISLFVPYIFPPKHNCCELRAFTQSSFKNTLFFIFIGNGSYIHTWGNVIKIWDALVKSQALYAGEPQMPWCKACQDILTFTSSFSKVLPEAGQGSFMPWCFLESNHHFCSLGQHTCISESKGIYSNNIKYDMASMNWV